MSPTFRCLTIMVTNRCPLRCAHCGPRSGPQERSEIELETVIAALEEARKRSCQMVNFSGGEPFVLGRKLVDMVQAAVARGLLTRITTGAYWSRTLEMAAQCLQPLAQQGLHQLFISYSDQHGEFVRLQNVIAATSAARSYGIQVYLALGTSRTSQVNSRSVREAFEAAGVAVPWILDSPLIPYGRAEENLSTDELLLQPVENLAGPCPSLTQHPTIHANGRVTGCAVVFGGNCAPLSSGNIYESTFAESLDRMNANPLAAWIHKIGVVELKWFIEANSSIRFSDRYVNICHLCGQILGNAEALAVLQEAGLVPLSANQ